MSVIQDFVEQKKRAKKNVAANLSEDEHATFQAILKWRIQQGFSRDSADLLRQMMHFVINKEYAQKYDFMLPDAQTIHSLINQHDGQSNGTSTAQG